MLLVIVGADGENCQRHRQVSAQLLYYDFVGLVPALGNAEIILGQMLDALECL